jgi:hypothetical protein
MKLTKFEALKNRYLVIGLYPNTQFSIGDIVFLDPENNVYRSDKRILNHNFPSVWECPKIFKKLEWFDLIDLTEIKSFKGLLGDILDPVRYEKDGIYIKDFSSFNNEKFVKYIHLEPVF